MFLKMILVNGADINAKCRNVMDANGWTALMYAAYYRHKHVMDFLIKEGMSNEKAERADIVLIFQVPIS